MTKLLAAFLVAFGGTSAGAAERESGRAATPFTLKDVTGTAVDVGAFMGKDVVLVNFFATWCAPCQVELPVLQKLHEKYAPMGLRIVVVSIDDPKSSAKVGALVRENGFTFPVLLDSQTKVASIYNPKKSVPFSVVIDRSGSVVSEKFGFQAGDAEKLEAQIATLLGGALEATPPPSVLPPE